ncbi:hypothetical protein AM592_17180 [Bacillus gobiensis]|uniref:Resolvase/invertase-type recombinase catalytic domain-containing protein n=1 Tax=Bacillus gobiensis TaxID=1441095 RepID=A0A0M4FJ80_9BACI|nr:hypothetical protein AM592_17180 [Bacillus gobiensis]
MDRGESGKNIKGRPALQQLLHDAKSKDFDLVLVWKVNRFSRKTKDLLNIVEELEMRNIVFHFKGGRIHLLRMSSLPLFLF